MSLINLNEVFSSFKGTTFASIDTTVDVSVNKTLTFPFDETGTNYFRAPNPFYGLVRKKSFGVKVMLFSNTKENGYQNLVNRTSKKEGIQEEFKVGLPVWGERIGDSPFIKHNDDVYLEVIFQSSGTYQFEVLKNKSWLCIEPSKILGMKEYKKPTQNNIENKVILRRYNLKSIDCIRAFNKVLSGNFIFNQESTTA